MKNRKLFYIWAGIIIAVGVFSLLGTCFRLGNLDIPFGELPRSYKTATILSISLMSFSLFNTVLWVCLLLLKIRWLSALTERLCAYVERPQISIILFGLFVLASLVSGQILFQSNASENILGTSFIDTTQIFFIWVILTSFISIVFVFVDRDYIQGIKKPDISRPFLLAVSIMTLLVLLNGSKYGFNKAYQPGIEGVFRLTGFPLLDYQVLFSWIAVVEGFFLISWMVKKWGKGRKVSAVIVDILIILCLFLGSFLISNSTPVVPNAFIDQPRPPNFTITPNLDAEIYERTAQSLLATGKMQTYIGEGDYLTVARRPLLALYLAGLHQAAGLGHEDILTLQLLYFSIVPGLIYLFAKTLHNRISAILAAVLMVIRHQNGLLLAHNVWGGTNLHMLMSDFPAMIIVILFLTLFVLWINTPKEKSLLPLIIGGVLGLGMLIRQEIAFILPMVSLIAVIKLKDRLRLLMSQLFLIFIGMVVVITPWMSRNWVKTGKLYLDKPGNRIERIFRTFNADDENTRNKIHDNPLTIEETGVLPSNPSLPEIDGNRLSQIQLIANHYANAVPQLFLYLPSNPLGLNTDYLQKMVNGKLAKHYGGFLYSPYKYAKSLPYWWYDQWDGKIDGKSWIYLTGIVGLISTGVYQVWKKERWITFVPLLAIFGMISIYAVSNASGGRLLQTVDWLSAMFLSIGLVEVSFRTLDYWRGKRVVTQELHGSDIFKEDHLATTSNTILALIFLGVVLFGASPVIAEIVLPNHYPESEMQLQLTSLLDEKNPTINQDDRDLLLNFMEQGGEVIYGRALYPRYYPLDAELMTTNQRIFPASTTFTIAGTELNFVILLRLEPPISFPHGSDALTFGCREVSFPLDVNPACLGCITGGFDALAVVQLNQDGQVIDILWRDGEHEQVTGCPLNWPVE